MRNHTEVNQLYRQRHPEKAKARQAVANAILRNGLVRQPCERCSEPETHAHHEDYSKPLDIVWLCRKCHNERHKELALLDPDKWSKPLPPRKQSPIPIEEVEKAIHLRKAGYTYLQIAERLNVAKSTVFKWLNDVTYS